MSMGYFQCPSCKQGHFATFKSGELLRKGAPLCDQCNAWANVIPGVTGDANREALLSPTERVISNA